MHTGSLPSQLSEQPIREDRGNYHGAPVLEYSSGWLAEKINLPHSISSPNKSNRNELLMIYVSTDWPAYDLFLETPSQQQPRTLTLHGSCPFRQICSAHCAARVSPDGAS